MEKRIEAWKSTLQDQNFFNEIISKNASQKFHLGQCQYVLALCKNLNPLSPYQRFFSNDMKKMFQLNEHVKTNVYYKAFNPVRNLWHMTCGPETTLGLLHECWDHFPELITAVSGYDNLEHKVQRANNILQQQDIFEKFEFTIDSHRQYILNFKSWQDQKRFIECIILGMYELQKQKHKKVKHTT